MFLRKFFESIRPESLPLGYGRHLKAGAQQRNTRPQLERLEDRTLLSFAPSVFYSAADPGSPKVAATGAIAVAAGDFERNGILDLVVGNSTSNNITVLTGNGGGGFAVFGGVFAVGKDPGALAVGDFGSPTSNRPDGIPDIVVANRLDKDINLLIGDGHGGFTVYKGLNFGVGVAPQAVAVGDFNGDGLLDVAVANFGSQVGSNDGSLSVLLRRSDGGFNQSFYTLGTNPNALAVGDFRRDGILDLAVTNFSSNTVSVLLGNGDGTFQAAQNYNTGSGPDSVAVGDFNGDGIPDLVVANQKDGTVSVLLGNGNGTFKSGVAYTAAFAPQAVVVGDFNGDGKPDLAVADGTSGGGNVSLLLGNGNGTFQSPVDFFAGTNNPIPGIVAGDFNRDGRLDLAVPNFVSPSGAATGGVSVLMNQAASTTVVSSTGNPTVVGQTVTFTATVSAVAPATGTPTGTVTFQDNGAALGSAVALSSGAATFSTASLTAGSHQITAIYSGDNTYSGSTSSAYPQMVLNPVPALASVSPSTIPEGSASFTLTVNGTNFVSGAAVQFSGAALVTTFVSGTQLTATVPAAAVAQDGPATITVVNPGLGGGGSNAQAFAVSDAPLTATGVGVTVAAGVTASNVLVATFTDAGGPEKTGNYTATINWGDGTTASVGTITVSGNTFTVAGSHTFVAPGRYTVSVAIQDSGGSTAAATSKAVIGSLNERFVSQAYLDLLGRTVDATGLKVFSAALDGGLSPSLVSQGITSSQEYRTDLIETDYQLFLHRTADLTGLGNFLNFLATGGTDEQMAVILTGSPEYFQNRGGGTNDGFLTALFQDALGRPIDAGGRTGFDQQLASGVTRAQVASAIFGSTEYRNDLVGSYYQRFLRRPADNGGLSGFVTSLANGAKDEDIIAALVGSTEYFARL